MTVLDRGNQVGENSEAQMAKGLRRQDQPAWWQLKRMCGGGSDEPTRDQSVCPIHLGLVEGAGLV